MIDISVKGLVKSFEVDNNILDGLSFEINSGERVGILGKNGSGKTTLFRILTGEIGYDEGEIVIASGKRIGLISQIPNYPPHYTVEDVLRSAHERLDRISARMEALAQKMGEDDSEEIMREYDRLHADFERLGGYDADVQRNRVANGLDIPQAMREQLFDSLSGGEKTRVNLARLILEDTDILLLDEPTNHLDLHATEWLEEYLLKFRGTVLTISHDRYFLDRVVQRTIDLVGGKAEFYNGNYSFYVVERQRRFDEQLKRYEKEQQELKRLDKAAQRLYQWGTGNQLLMKKSQAIRSRMERIEQTERPRKDRKLKARFGEKTFRGDEVLSMDGLSKSYGDRTLFSGLQLEITGGERIGLIGDNGSGKSTLIKMIMGEVEPDTGWVERGPSIKTAYLPQIIHFDDPDRSLMDTLIYSNRCTPQEARNRLGAFRFVGDDVFKPVSVLSGGEQSRLRLCMLMRDEINFLILDEPTNHLDIDSREWIEEAVDDYDEALLFVSHDRYFINRFATRIWEIHDGTITDFRGTFEEFRRFKERQTALQQSAKHAEKKVEKKSSGKGKKKSGASPEKRMGKLEREIEKTEARLTALGEEMETHASDYQKLMELSEEQAATEAELEALYAQWEELAQ
ncbi:MAG: ribosomal protection-like ABC-F family protein [Oscillospiraceae bacterium]|jgi:ATP-binding cassette subfamily F protein 3